MNRKATAIAPANIAFIKYWGAHNLERGLPLNPSISMTLTRCVSTCTVEAQAGGAAEASSGGSGDPAAARSARHFGDAVYLAESGGIRPAPERFACRVLDHLDRLRCLTGENPTFRVATRNSFPGEAGLASSASGFAALTLATTKVLGIEPSAPELSALARRSGSGSAARSVIGGYVELPGGPHENDVHARTLAEADHWDLCDVIALVATEPKSISSLEGHRRAPSSPYFQERLAALPERLGAVREGIERSDLGVLGPTIEEEGIDLHLIAMSSSPPIFYWSAGTVEVLAEVRRLRREGIEAYSTMDAGPNVHVICQRDVEDVVATRLAALGAVRDVIRDGVGPGPRFSEDHLL